MKSNGKIASYNFINPRSGKNNETINLALVRADGEQVSTEMIKLT